MFQPAVLDARAFAQQTWGAVQVGDQRLTARAVVIGTRAAMLPGASLPMQAETEAELDATYRFLDNDQVTFDRLSQPYWQQTRAAAAELPVALLIQDDSPVDCTRYRRTMRGLGPIGNGKGEGFLLHTTIVVDPATRQTVGVAHQRVDVRSASLPRAERRTRPKEERESRFWSETVRALGCSTTGLRQVMVCDRGADDSSFLQACRADNYGFVLRMAQDRRDSRSPDNAPVYLMSAARTWASVGTRTVRVRTHDQQPAPPATPTTTVTTDPATPAIVTIDPATPATAPTTVTTDLTTPPVPATSDPAEPAPPTAPDRVPTYRTAQLQVAYGQMEIRLTRSPKDPPLTVWVVRAWEAEPPLGVEPVEWLLLTNVPVTSLDEALARLDWYACRWVIEEYHQCLKTGCALEQRDFEDVQRLFRLLAFLSPSAVRLLQVRDAARQTPDAPATLVADPMLVALVGAKLGWTDTTPTVQQFWRGVARLGGYRGHRTDGPPGWKTLWRGWLRLQDMHIGATLARQLALA